MKISIIILVLLFSVGCLEKEFTALGACYEKCKDSNLLKWRAEVRHNSGYDLDPEFYASKEIRGLCELGCNEDEYYRSYYYE